MKIDSSKNEVQVKDGELEIVAKYSVATLDLDGKSVRLSSRLVEVYMKDREGVKDLYRKIEALSLDQEARKTIFEMAETDLKGALLELEKFEKRKIVGNRFEFFKGLDTHSYANKESFLWFKANGSIYKMGSSDPGLADLPLLLSQVSDYDYFPINIASLKKLEARAGELADYLEAAKLVIHHLRWQLVELSANWILNGNDQKELLELTLRTEKIISASESDLERTMAISALKRFFVNPSEARAELDEVDGLLSRRKERERFFSDPSKRLEREYAVKAGNGVLVFFQPHSNDAKACYVTSAGEAYVDAQPWPAVSVLTGLVTDLRSGLAEKILEDPALFGLKKLEDDWELRRVLSLAKKADPKLALLE